MKIVGRRFWTWMSVWAMSFLVKGQMFAGPQEKSTTPETRVKTSSSHKIPVGSYSLGKGEQKRWSKINQFKTTSGRVIEKTSGKGLHDNPTESLKTQSKSKPRGHKGGK